MSISSTTSLRIRLLAAALLVLGTAHASEPPTTPGMERVKQDMIYQSKGGDRPEGYIIDRSLLYTLTEDIFPKHSEIFFLLMAFI
jgi:hypothetical protein